MQDKLKVFSHSSKPGSLTIAILSLNEASIISDSLISAAFADQLVVIDSGSTDGTVDIAKSHGAEVHTYLDWQGFATQKNRALQHCLCEYVFFLDCDEIIPPKLASEIRAVVEQGSVNLGLIRWEDYVFGKRLRGIHQTKGVARLFKISDIKDFNGKVHESAAFRSEPSRLLLQTPLVHHSRRSVHQSLLKLAQYSQLAAIEIRESRAKSGILTGAAHAFSRFINLYFIKLSLLSGAEGFLYSLLISLEVFFKYCAARFDHGVEANTPARR
jgi:glycosyltransferase involved in cell wall biosynthesis